MKFFVVATPIGNLKDISQRAIEALQGVDFILCEDTRWSKKLLDFYSIKKPLISFHQHSKLQKIDNIISLLKENKNLALVTDAGTPGVADPGGVLIEKILQVLPETEIIPIPGACALATALSASGLPADRFVFMGFPPAKKARQKFFSEVLASKYAVVFYESPYRILKTLNELLVISQSQNLEISLVVCRELTKLHETIYRGAIDQVIASIKKHALGGQPKGEFVVIVKNN